MSCENTILISEDMIGEINMHFFGKTRDHLFNIDLTQIVNHLWNANLPDGNLLSPIPYNSFFP